MEVMIFSLKSLCSFHVFAGTGVYSYHFSVVYEHRNLDLRSGFKRSVLEGVRRSVALDGGFGLGNEKVDKEGGLDREDVSFVRNDFADDVFLNELEVVGENVFAQRHLLVSIGIHKVIKIAVVVKIFHIFSFDYRLGEFVRRGERFFNNGTRYHVLYFRADEGGSLTGLYVLKFYDGINVSVHFESQTVSEITS